MFLDKDGIIKSASEPQKNRRKYWYDTTNNKMYILEDGKYLKLNKPINVVTGSEFKTGKLRNGKEEWCKVISCGALPNAGQNIVNIGFNVKENPIHKIEGIARNTENGATRILPYVNCTYLNYCVQIDIWEDNRIALITKHDWSAYNTSYITLYFTKK